MICDTTGGFSQEELQSLNIKTLPLSVNFSDGTTLVEGTRETYLSYYTKLNTLEQLPTTSQPPVGIVCEAFEQALQEGDQVIAISLSHGLSGTYSSFMTAADMIDPDRISVVDSLSCSVSIKFLARIARKLIDAGKSRLDIVHELNAQAKRSDAIMFVDDLKFLKKGGRVGNLSFFVGKLLHIHPILMMKDGYLVAHDKVRGMRAVFDRMIRELPDKLKYLTVLHCANEAGALGCIEKLRARFRDSIEIELEDLSPVIGTHLGNGSVGIIYCW